MKLTSVTSNLSHVLLADLLSKTILRLVLAAFLGGIIGLERELKHRPAGLRTNMFICFGAAMFTILSSELAEPGDRAEHRSAQERHADDGHKQELQASVQDRHSGENRDLDDRGDEEESRSFR